MAININHKSGKISSETEDLKLDAIGTDKHISASDNRIKNVLDPVDAQDAVTKRYLEDNFDNLTGGSGVTISDVENLINQALATIDLLKPQSPPYMSTKVLTVDSLSSYRITDFTQTDNTGTGLSASAGSTVTNVRRGTGFITNTIEQVGPGNSGTVEIKRNGVVTSNKTLDETDNAGVYTDTDNLLISNNVDYGTITGNPLGFDFVVDIQATGNANEGWNNIQLRHDLTGSSEVLTNTVEWYSDHSDPGAPEITNSNITESTTQTGTVYSSTVPHYTNQQQFDISFDVNKLSGDFYPSTDTFVQSAGVSAASAINPISSITYQDANITTPLPRNYLANSTTNVTTSVSVKSGTGIAGPLETISLVVDNSYHTTTETFTVGKSILYMFDDLPVDSIIDETNTLVQNVGFGSGNARRLETVNGETPVETVFNDFNGQTSTLNDWDATVVGGVLSHDETDYSTGYLPVGPDLSNNRSNNQYITFAFNRTAVSKFAIEWSGKVSGCWVRIPGTLVDSSSTLNGWMDTTVPYEGIGVPGANTSAGGNGSNGCGLAGTVTTGTTVNRETVNVTFGTESSSNATNNLILVRFKLAQGDSISVLKFKTAT